MKPPAGIGEALLQAARDLATPQQAPTLVELAAHAQVGMQSARGMVPKLKRSGALRIVRTRRVPRRNRPVAEYEAVGPQAADGAGTCAASLACVLGAWGQG